MEIKKNRIVATPRSKYHKYLFGGSSGSSSGGSISIDTNNFVKKTGEATQTIEGDIIVNGNIISTGEVSAYGAGSAGSGSGTSGSLGALVNVGLWADEVTASDRIMVQLAGATHWSSKLLSEIVGLDTVALGAYLVANSYAKQSYVDARVAELVGTAPSTLDTLNELAAALGNDPNFATSMSTLIGTKWTTDNTKIANWDSAYTAMHSHANKTVLDGITGTLVGNWNTAYTNNHTHANKTILDLITQGNIDVLSHFSVVDGRIKVDVDFYSTGEVSAYGAGSGSGGGSGSGIIETVYGSAGLGGSYLDSDFTNTFNAYTINLINNNLTSALGRIGALETSTPNVSWGTPTSQYSPLTINSVTRNLSLDGHSHSYLPLTGGVLSGNGKIEPNGNITLSQYQYGANATGLWWKKLDGSSNVAGIGSLTNGDELINMYMGWGINPWNSATNLSVSNSIFTYKNYSIWHAGNDGAGSGLDADLLDGYQLSSIFKAYGGTPSSNVDFNTYPFQIGTTFYGGGNGTGNSNQPFSYGQLIELGNRSGGYGHSVMLASSSSNTLHYRNCYYNGSGGGFSDWKQIAFTTDLNSYLPLSGGRVEGDLFLGTISSPRTLVVNYVEGENSTNLNLNRYGGQVLINNQTAWHAGNDGAGSGLDADLIDGINSNNIVYGTNGYACNSIINADFNTINKSGLYTIYGGANSPTGSNQDKTYSLLSILEGSLTGSQLAYSFYGSDSGNLYVRGALGGSFSAWRKIWHDGNDGDGSGLDADMLDGVQLSTIRQSNIYNLGNYYGEGTTVADCKQWIVDRFNSAASLGVGANVIVGRSYIDQWDNNAGTYYPSAVYSMIKIGGGYENMTYGQFLLSSYDLTNIGVVGRTGNNWTSTKWLAFTTDNVASASKLQTARTIWGQSFNGEADVNGTVFTNIGVKSRNICIETDNLGNASSRSSEINNYNSHLFLQYNTANNTIICNGGGNVGIGTTSPQYKLDVNGIFRSTENGYINGDLYVGSGSVDKTILTRIISSHDSGVLKLNPWGGNVVIGAENAIEKLYVNGSTKINGYFRVDNNVISAGEYEDNKYGFINVCRTASIENASYFSMVRAGTGAFGIGLSTDNAIIIGGAAVDKIINNIHLKLHSDYVTTSKPLSSSSRISTGYDSWVPNSISCSNWFRSNGESGWFNDSKGAGIYSDTANVVRTYGTNKFKVYNEEWDSISTYGGICAYSWFRSNGDSGWYNQTYGGGIYMTDSTYVKVYGSKSFWVNGNVVATGEVTAYSASDIRLKTNIKPITSAIDVINKLNPVSYNWNEKAKELNPLKTDSTEYGLIAQELEEVLPELVHPIYDGEYKSIDYVKIVPLLIGAIKELQLEINKLKNK